MPRPGIYPDHIKTFLDKNLGQRFSIPEICAALNIDSWKAHAAVRRVLLQRGYRIVAQEDLRHNLVGRGGRRKAVNLWGIE